MKTFQALLYFVAVELAKSIYNTADHRGGEPMHPVLQKGGNLQLWKIDTLKPIIGSMGSERHGCSGKFDTRLVEQDLHHLSKCTSARKIFDPNPLPARNSLVQKDRRQVCDVTHSHFGFTSSNHLFPFR